MIGCLTALIGLALIGLNKVLPSAGQLPGDIQIEWGNVSCFFPLATSIILSIILTVVLNLLIRLFNQ